MEALKQEIRHLMALADTDISFAELAEGFTGALERHPEALGGLTGRYRLRTTDTQRIYSFALSADGYRTLGETEPVDAAISGREADLLSLFRRELTPVAAMLKGKVRVQGSMQALAKFAQLL